MKDQYKKKALKQLNQAKGMLNKVISMIEEGEYCIDVLQQSLAVIGFTKSANRTITANHLRSCFKSGMASKNTKKQEKLIAELLHIIDKS